MSDSGQYSVSVHLDRVKTVIMERRFLRKSTTMVETVMAATGAWLRRFLLSAGIVTGMAAAMSSSAVAQEIQLMLDRYGNRVLVDVYTGELVAVDDGEGGWVSPLLEENLVRARPGGRRDGYSKFHDKWFGDGAEPPNARYNDRGYRFRDGRVDRRRLPDNDISPDIEVTEPEWSDRETQSAGLPPVRDTPLTVKKPDADKEAIAAFQVLLDRVGASPGVIDGRWGQNVANAAAAYEEITGKSIDPEDRIAVEVELMATGGPALIDYTITAADIAGPYVAAIPVDYSQKAQLQTLAYTSVREMLAEKFHMDENYLAALNPNLSFNRAGTTIRVANVGPDSEVSVARIIADKAREQVRAYDASGALVMVYPSTIGSASTPSPSGTVAVERIAFDPNYTYNPKINFKQGDNDKVLTIPPGPNGPVGTIWIALSKPTYGIHGTPAPSKIGKTNSHGCVRLTNWDATELAKAVSKGVTVEFLD